MKRNKGICMDDVNSEFARQLDYELIEESFEENLANLNSSIAHLQQAIGGSGGSGVTTMTCGGGGGGGAGGIAGVTTYGGSGPLVIHQVQ